MNHREARPRRSFLSFTFWPMLPQFPPLVITGTAVSTQLGCVIIVRTRVIAAGARHHSRDPCHHSRGASSHSGPTLSHLCVVHRPRTMSSTPDRDDTGGTEDHCAPARAKGVYQHPATCRDASQDVARRTLTGRILQRAKAAKWCACSSFPGS